MTRLVWKLKAAGHWLALNRDRLAEMCIVAFLAISLLALARCSLAKQERDFKGITYTIVHTSSPDGSTLVTFTRHGTIEGREFPTRETAEAFAEAIQ